MVEATVRGRDLILVAAGLLQNMTLQANRLDRQILLGKEPALEAGQRTDEPDGEGGARAQSAPSRQVGVVVDLDVRPVEPLQRHADQRVLDLRQLRDQLDA